MRIFYFLFILLFVHGSMALAQSCIPAAGISPAGIVNICSGDNITLTAPASNAWTIKAPVSANLRENAVGFSVLSKGYIGTGFNGTTHLNDFWEYDQISDTWTQKANFGGGNRSEAVGFAVGTKGYITTGWNGTTHSADCWEFDPVANTWTARANFPGAARRNAVGFSVGARGYVGTGFNGTTRYSDFYEYNPATNSWQVRTAFPGVAREGAVGFGFGGRGYLGTGFSGSARLADFYEFNPTTNAWQIRSAFPGTIRSEAVGFQIGNARGYIGTGLNGTTRFSDFYEFNPATNAWLARTNFSGTSRNSAVGLSIGNKGYIGTGSNSLFRYNNFYEYDPGYTYNWSNGETTQSISVSEDGNYFVTLTSVLNSGCSQMTVPTFVKMNLPDVEITPGGSVNICSGSSTVLNANNSNVWVQKTDFGGVARRNSVGFSIGNKGYLGTGFNGSTYYNDLWEYDPEMQTWIQKASLATARSGAVGFSIGSKGYIGTGNNASSRLNDFWEYDPLLNTWTARANFAGSPRNGAVGLSIGAKGYIGTGVNLATRYNDFWEYNPVNDMWIRRADFGGTVRSYATGFSVGAKGYVGTGSNGVTRYKDFWEYNPTSNSWVQIADFGGTARDAAVAFSIASKGFVGTGYDGAAKRDFWEYDPVANAWSSRADAGTNNRDAAAAFSIGLKGYIGAGWDGVSVNRKDFWEFDPGYTYLWSTGQTTQNIIVSQENSYTVTLNDVLTCSATSSPTRVFIMTPIAEIYPAGIVNECPGANLVLTAPSGNKWNQQASFMIERAGAVGFSIGKYGYLGTGGEGTFGKVDFWEYDPENNTWTQKSDLPGPPRIFAVGFSIAGKGYIGTGQNGSTRYKDFWEYDPVTNLWVQKADFEGTARSGAIGFSLQGKGYIGTGNDGVNKKDIWVYNPAKDQWRKAKDFPGTERQYASGLSIGNKGYLGLGLNASTVFNDFWEYDPVSNNWLARANFGGSARLGAVAFSIGQKGYVGTGEGSSLQNDFWEYDPITNVWTIRATFPGNPRRFATGFSIFAKGYISIGFNGDYLRDVWAYEPAYNYNWSNGQTTPSITVTNASSFHVTITDALGCSALSEPTLVTRNLPGAVISPSGTINTCAGTDILLTEVQGAVGWTQKQNFGGIARSEAVGFSIGNKGYLGTGLSFSQYHKDFWEFDPLTNSWTQKADFGGQARSLAVGFNIADKGYIGTGRNATFIFKDFWEYDPVANVWTQKADCSPETRYHATGFGLSSKGYIGLGYKTGVIKNDFWEYDPSVNTWTQKLSFPGPYRVHAFGFGIDEKGYVGSGNLNGNKANDFWEYDPAANTWMQKANIGGSPRCCAFSFSISNRGFVGGGFGVNGPKLSDFLEYDVLTDTWVNRPHFGGRSRARAVGFAINGKGYAGTGADATYKNDFWEFGPNNNSFLWSTGETTSNIVVSTPGSYTVTVFNENGCSKLSAPVIINHNNPLSEINPAGTVNICVGDTASLNAVSVNNEVATWTRKADFGGVPRGQAIGFSIDGKGYISTGHFSGSYYRDFWEFDPVSNAWSQKANFGGNVRASAVGFKIGNKGYIGTGHLSFNYFRDFWEYNPATNVWTRKADFPGLPRFRAVGFSIGGKGYLGTGLGQSYAKYKDFWEYDPATDTWLQKADFGGGNRFGAVGLSNGSKCYIGSGGNNSGIPQSDFWEYDPLANTWIQKTDIGVATIFSTGFSIGRNLYIGLGNQGGTSFKEYDPEANSWSVTTNFPGGNLIDAVGFAIGNKGYIGTGYPGTKLFWEFNPNKKSFLWSNGETSPAISVTEPGDYTVTITEIGGCSTTSSPTTLSVNTINTWPGGGTSDWNNPANWSCGIVPNHPLVDAVILNGAVPMPVLNADVLVRSLTLNGTSTVDINGRKLTLNRNITGTGSLKGSIASNLTLKGATGTVRFTSGASILKDLLLTDTASATLGTPLSIAAGAIPGSVSVHTNAVLNTSGNLTLLSDVNGTARVGKLTGNILGDVTVERFINTGTNPGEHAKSWQFLATPTTGQSMRQAWQENGTTPNGYGTIITGTGTGFDFSTVAPSAKFYHALSNSWSAVTNTNNPVQEKLGYMIFVRGDRTVTSSSGFPNNTNLRSKGALFTPFNPPPAVPILPSKFQSFGNPYASRIEFSKVFAASTGINNVFYVWDPKLGGSYGYGGYQTISEVTGYIPTAGSATTYYPAGVPSPFIESGQAVFVQGNALGGQINFNENIKDDGNRLVHRGDSGTSFNSERQFLFASLFTTSGTIADGAILAFENGLGNELNDFDAAKRMNDGENLGFLRGDSILAVEARDAVAVQDTVHIYIKNLRQQTYQFRFAPVNMQSLGYSAYFVDRYMQSSVPLSLADSSFIDVGITADSASSAENRFLIVFSLQGPVPVHFIHVSATRRSDKSNFVRWRVANETDIDKYEIERSSDGVNFSKIGEQLPSDNQGGDAGYVHVDDNPAPATNYYRISALSRDGRKQYSSIVKLIPDIGPIGIFVYPNPFVGHDIHLRITGKSAGEYIMKMINASGQTIIQQVISVAPGENIFTISLDKTIAAGTYQLILTNAEGQRDVISIIKAD